MSYQATTVKGISAERLLEEFAPSSYVQRETAAIKKLNAPAALNRAAEYALLCLVDAPFAWYFDLDSTRQFFADNALLFPAPILLYGPALGMILLILTPFIFEMTLSQMAARGGILAAVIWMAWQIFDGRTDYPRVEAFISAILPAAPFFDAPGLFLAHWGALLFGLFVATTVFETVFVAAFVCVLVALWYGLPWNKVPRTLAIVALIGLPILLLWALR